MTAVAFFAVALAAIAFFRMTAVAFFRMTAVAFFAIALAAVAFFRMTAVAFFAVALAAIAFFRVTAVAVFTVMFLYKAISGPALVSVQLEDMPFFAAGVVDFQRHLLAPAQCVHVGQMPFDGRTGAGLVVGMSRADVEDVADQALRLFRFVAFPGFQHPGNAVFDAAVADAFDGAADHTAETMDRIPIEPFPGVIVRQVAAKRLLHAGGQLMDLAVVLHIDRPRRHGDNEDECFGCVPHIVFSSVVFNPYHKLRPGDADRTDIGGHLEFARLAVDVALHFSLHQVHGLRPFAAVDTQTALRGQADNAVAAHFEFGGAICRIQHCRTRHGPAAFDAVPAAGRRVRISPAPGPGAQNGQAHRDQRGPGPRSLPDHGLPPRQLPHDPIGQVRRALGAEFFAKQHVNQAIPVFLRHQTPSSANRRWMHLPSAARTRRSRDLTPSSVNRRSSAIRCRDSRSR